MPGESTGDGAGSALRGCRTSGRFRPCSPRSLQMEGGRPGRPSGSLEFSINSYRTALGGTEPQPLLTASSIIVVMPLACPEAWRELAAVLTEGTHIPGANTRHPHGQVGAGDRTTLLPASSSKGDTPRHVAGAQDAQKRCSSGS